MSVLKKPLYFFTGMLVLIALWQVSILVGGYDEALFPSPPIVWEAIVDMLRTGILWEHLSVSLGRFMAGYFIAVIPAILLGLIFGRLTYAWNIVDPIVQVLRPISPVAWSPFIVLWFGIGNIPAIVIIFIAAFFPVLLTTVNGVRRVDPDYLKIAQNLEVGSVKLLIRFIFPAAFPAIVSGLRLALGTAWIFLVAGEMVGSQSGLGFMIVDARNTLNLSHVLAGILIIGVLGFLLDRAISFFEKWVGRYYGAPTD